VTAARKSPVEAAGQGARAAALAALSTTLRKRRPLDAAFEGESPTTPLDARDRSFARAIANETMRRFGQLEALVRHFVPRPPPPHRAGPALEILLAGACELLFLGVPAHAAVDGANRLAARDAKAVHFKPLINATLRRIAREGAQVLEVQDSSRLNLPDWLWMRWCENFGEAGTRAIAQIHARPAPLDLNVGDAAEPDLAQEMAAATGSDVLPLPGGILRLQQPGAIELLPGFAGGAWWVQDFAASLPVHLLGDVRRRRVFDLCAAPGGKTAQLVRLGADVTAVDQDGARLARLGANLERLKMHARIEQADIREFAPEALADFILLDAPCSGTGTIRRHPELPWIKSAADIQSCVSIADELLDAAARLVRERGMLVFAVCSLEPEEGEEQIAAFLARNSAFRRVPITASDVFGAEDMITGDGDLRTLPSHRAEQGGMDGFYAARLERL
jgi:16S rRNA (cytosine967-C5)-methyltransferase